MKILHLTASLGLAGAGRSLVAIARHLRDLGDFRHTVISLLPAQAGALAHAEARGVRVLDVPGPEELRREIEAADILQIEWWNTATIYEILFSDLPPARILIFLHVAGDIENGIVSRELVDFADFVVAGCKYAHDRPAIAELAPDVRASKTAVVPATTDLDRLVGVRPRPHEGFNVTYIGNVDPKKMHPAFVAMCAAVRAPGARFIVCGRENAAFVRQIEERGALDRFDLRGWVDDIGAVLSISDVFGYPLGIPPGAELALQEAMLAGVPPVVFPIGGLRDAVEDGRTGVVVRTERAYVEAIEWLYQHPEERRRLGDGARDFAVKTYGGANSARLIAPIYERMMYAPKRARSFRARHYDVVSGARLFVESMGPDGAPFAESLDAADLTGALVADARLPSATWFAAWALSSYVERSPDDGMLRLWYGRARAQLGDEAAALAELRAAEACGVNARRARLDAGVVVLAAHPDDETLGFGAHLHSLGAACTLVHVTDGAPRDLGHATNRGFPDREAYAEARRSEMLSAVAEAGIRPEQCTALGYVDQEAALHLVELVERLQAILLERRPCVLVTHAYEGGHPDHDACAFAAQLAVDGLARCEAAPERVEFTSYHLRDGAMRVSEFLPGPTEVHTRVLDDEERARKLRMYNHYRTQRSAIRNQPVAVERRRLAPRYDFTRPPHDGRLFYETYPSGMTPERWIFLATAALKALHGREEELSGVPDSLDASPAQRDIRVGLQPAPTRRG